MASGRVCDTRCQNFHTSVIKNENAARMKWFIKNENLLLKNLENSKITHKVENDLKSLSWEGQKNKKSREEKKKLLKDEGKISTNLMPEKSGVLDINIMRPIDPKTKNIIYEAGVETFTAASQYLNKRYKEKPEDRFYYPECTSWNYGWRLKDHPSISTSQFGNRSIIQSSFYRRNASSLSRDPEWYKICQTKNPKNFNDILTY